MESLVLRPTAAFGDNGRAPSSQRQQAHAILPVWVWVGVTALCIYGTSTPNPTLTVLAIIILVACMQLLWRRGEPPVLVFALGMQWLQAAGSIFYSNSYGLSLEQAAGGSWEYEEATFLSLIAVLVLAIGMRLSLLGAKKADPERLTSEALRVNVTQAFVLYLITFFIASTASFAGWFFPSVTQLILALAVLKWIGVYILAYSVLEQRKGYFFLSVCVLLEVATGLISYFSTFKSVFFVVVIAALTSPLALKGRRLGLTLGLASIVFCFGIVWTAIKQDYREFLNGGENQQIVTVTAEESADRLADLISKLNWRDISDGMDTMILRVSYTQFFAQAMVNVPTSIPFENGQLWSEAVEHILTPRLFFPNKGIVDDSERTRLYTGVEVAGYDQGTSIGIGYVAESYIDFGPTMMFLPILLLGAFFGGIYRFFMTRAKEPLLASAVGASILIFQAYTIETSNIKILGGIVTELLVLTPLYFALRRPVMQAIRR